MSEVVIKTEGLGKRYRLGEFEQFGTLRDVLTGAFKAPARALRGREVATPRSRRDEIWALQDVSFEVNAGEVVGLIGRNGAGKTTLLKILARITDPTEGRAFVRGRVRSLLEVGTGFHPELTGRENVYLNGAILGMRKRELNRRFDAIVAFAEVERFIDTPVKRYSTGMQVRLAFAVAAHLEPEVLLVDEVLAVGDTAFQKKCLGKLEETARSGRTVLFVSHNLVAVRTLCDRALLIEQGRLTADTTPVDAVDIYLGEGRSSKAEMRWDDTPRAPGNALFRMRAVRIRNAAGEVSSTFRNDEPFDIEVEYQNLVERTRLGATVLVYNEENVLIFSSLSNKEQAWHERPMPLGLFRSTCRVPGDLLAEGYYTVSVMVWANYYSSYRREDSVVEFDVKLSPDAPGDYFSEYAGMVRPELSWSTEFVGEPSAAPEPSHLSLARQPPP